jgi:hypothetical protein
MPLHGQQSPPTAKVTQIGRNWLERSFARLGLALARVTAESGRRRSKRRQVKQPNIM